jgi:hypothetical protein
MEGASEIALSLPETSFTARPPADSPGGYFSSLTEDNRSPLIYRNYRNTDFLGSVTIMDVGWSGGHVIAGKDGPYRVADSQLPGELLAAEFSLDAAAGERTWTGFQVPLGSDGELLEQAGEVELPFRFYGFSGPGAVSGNITVIVQFGALSDEDSSGTENTALMVEAQLYPLSAGAGAFYDPRRLRLTLNDEDRQKLQGARYMRIIIHNRGEALEGRLLLARPIVRGSRWQPVIMTKYGNGGIVPAPGSSAETIQGGEALVHGLPSAALSKSVSVIERSDSSGALRGKYRDLIDRLHSGGARQQILEVHWQSLESGEAAGAGSRFPLFPLRNYRSLSFFITRPLSRDSKAPISPEDTEFRFILARGPDSLANGAQSREITLDLRIPGKAFAANLQEGEWTRVEARYGDGEVLVNGVPISGAVLNFEPNGLTALENSGEDATQGTLYAAVFFGAPAGSSQNTPALPDGSFSIDEILLENPVPSYRIAAGTALEYHYPGIITEFRGKPILENLTVKTALESAARGNPFPDSGEAETFMGASSRSAAGITVLGVRLEGNLTLKGSNGTAGENFSWGAGHGLSHSWGPLSVLENFSLSPADAFMDHVLALSLKSRFSALLESKLRYEEEKLERRWISSLGLAPGPELPLGIGLSADACWTEDGETMSLSNYAEAWAYSWEPMIPDSGDGADKRDAYVHFGTSLTTIPVGVELEASARSEAAGKNGLTRSTALGRIGMPVNIADWRLLFSIERVFRRTLFYYGGDIMDDSSAFTEALEDSLPLWYSIPFYALFADSQADTMSAAIDNSRSVAMIRDAGFTDRAALNIAFPVQYSLVSFFLPRSFEAEIKRVLERKLDTPADTLFLGSGLVFSSLNIFGAFGAAPLFRFYQSDEFGHTIRAGLGIPRVGDLSWNIQDEQHWSFYGFTGAELSLANTLTLGSPGLLESLILSWTAPSKNSLLGVLYIWFCSKMRDNDTWPALARLAESEYERLRRESLEIVIDTRGEYPQTAFILGHESIIRIIGRLNLSVFAKLTCAQNYGTRIFSFIGTLGTSVTVHF